MTRSRVYPIADRETQWWESSFDRGTFTAIDKILLHTTETTGWPGYASGSMAPTLTYHPRLRKWRQHNYLDRSARALVDPTSTVVRENRDNVIQIEIIAYADEKIADQVGGLKVTELTDAQLGDIAAFIKYVRAEWGGPPLVAAPFKGYPSSYGLSNGVRFTGPQYDAFKGILGHMHAPQQNHGDPGSINIGKIIQLATPPVPATTSVGELDVDEATLRRIIREEVDKLFDGQKASIARAVWGYKNPNVTTIDAYAIIRFGLDLPKPPTATNTTS